MVSWTLILITLVIGVVVLATRGRRGVRALGHGHVGRTGGRRKVAPDLQLQTADDSTNNTRKAPNLEYQGQVYFFCSIEERDICTANLRIREFHLSEAANTSRAIERRA